MAVYPPPLDIEYLTKCLLKRIRAKIHVRDHLVESHDFVDNEREVLKVK